MYNVTMNVNVECYIKSKRLNIAIHV